MDNALRDEGIKYIESNIPESEKLSYLISDMEKSASPIRLDKHIKSEGAVAKEMLEFIKDKKHKFNTKDYGYVVVSAMGAGEIWGGNLNADYFEKAELLDAYLTFLKAHYYKNHVNKNPKKSFGVVSFAAYNQVMERVELLIAISKERAAQDLEDIDNGSHFDVSMGTKIHHDECSICGNKAVTSIDYCKHIKKEKNKIYPDGRKVVMINKGCKFFDISRVKKGADESSKSIMKVASVGGNDAQKNSSMDKNVSGNVPGIVVVSEKDFNKFLQAAGKNVQGSNDKEKEIISKIKEGSLSLAFSTFRQKYDLQ